MEIVGEGGALTARWGDMVLALEPAGRTLFGGTVHPFYGPDRFVFERDAGGRVVRLDWDGETFERID